MLCPEQLPRHVPLHEPSQPPAQVFSHPLLQLPVQPLQPEQLVQPLMQPPEHPSQKPEQPIHMSVGRPILAAVVLLSPFLASCAPESEAVRCCAAVVSCWLSGKLCASSFLVADVMNNAAVPHTAFRKNDLRPRGSLLSLSTLLSCVNMHLRQ
jgi:hypothetical protein